MKNAMRLIMAGMLCMVLAAQESENEGCPDYLEHYDVNSNGKITCAEVSDLWTQDSQH